jgi:putative endopeptidase
LGENIGDLGGINAAYDGLQLYLKRKWKVLNNGTTTQIWRSKARDEATKTR